ncbi:hypothetical protein GCM10007989_17870 [Devosia pacifica]|uniref:DUF2259 domain-containing protein n=1 Tax=Devosia pacifica TaxID=1335967 RepID=A0A918S3M5_9HYPH|nr:DUF2259 domain-containing protein [Devosia pacifica]GHA22846.1 hypothetical protein GCM10007989_17870 [Devosia pacifica]
MRQSGDMVASARRVIAAASLSGATLVAGPATAGDRALLDVIGFSEDSRYFAFEEYGIQDGSGFAYSNIYVIDLNADRWAADTPVRIRDDESMHGLRAIRRQASDTIQPVMSDLEITEPAETLALNADGELSADDYQLNFGLPPYGLGEVRGIETLRLESFKAPTVEPCSEWFDIAPLGFRLSIERDGAITSLFEDETVPASRGCPYGYRLYGVFLPFEEQDTEAGVAVISVYPGGFEGPDRRFIAVPLRP